MTTVEVDGLVSEIGLNMVNIGPKPGGVRLKQPRVPVKYGTLFAQVLDVWDQNAVCPNKGTQQGQSPIARAANLGCRV